ncbi:hypothetical protein ElyMa_005106700 [Elysia marginata]|uniref:Uncharacterized protein n=1 Tax=Elysia marginata TaxID=1093978 RepID=A0AAV4JHV8_9GAST|nr:hypothetical protein ElyMa_005106700 [Elysia marginata]
MCLITLKSLSQGLSTDIPNQDSNPVFHTPRAERLPLDHGVRKRMKRIMNSIRSSTVAAAAAVVVVVEVVVVVMVVVVVGGGGGGGGGIWLAVVVILWAEYP